MNLHWIHRVEPMFSMWTAKQRQVVDQKLKCSWIKKNYSLNIFSDRSFLFFSFPVLLCLRLIERMSWRKKKKKREVVHSEWIGNLHSAVGSKSLSLQTKLTVFLEAIVARHIQRDSFYSQFYFCLIFLITETPSQVSSVFSSLPFLICCHVNASAMKRENKQKYLFSLSHLRG